MLLLTEMGNAIEGVLGDVGVDPYVVRNTPLATLLLLHFEGPMRPTVLSKRAAITTGGMTKVIDQLVERGLIARDGELAEDGRAVIVSITERGRELADRVCASSYPVLREGIDRLATLEIPVT